jgi:hypothetical protein
LGDFLIAIGNGRNVPIARNQIIARHRQ